MPITEVGYLNPEWKGRTEPPRILSGATRRANTSPQSVEVHDARALAEAGGLDLDTNGFIHARHRSSVTDFRDPAQIRDVYLHEMSELLSGLTGADQVFAHFFAPIRSENPEFFFGAYSLYMHCDYALSVEQKRIREVLKLHNSPLAEAAPGWDFAWYNVWRPIDHEVQARPLTLLDASTLDPADVVEYRPTDDEFASLPVFDERQRLYYFPRMQTDEVAIFKQLDTRRERAQVCPHTSFHDPDSPPDALPRRSIELRLMCAFAPEA